MGLDSVKTIGKVPSDYQAEGAGSKDKKSLDGVMQGNRVVKKCDNNACCYVTGVFLCVMSVAFIIAAATTGHAHFATPIIVCGLSGTAIIILNRRPYHLPSYWHRQPVYEVNVGSTNSGGGFGTYAAPAYPPRSSAPTVTVGGHVLPQQR